MVSWQGRKGFQQGRDVVCVMAVVMIIAIHYFYTGMTQFPYEQV